MNNESYHAFISYAMEDRDTFVDPLVCALKAEGIDVWYDKNSLFAGQSLRGEIDNALARSKAGIVVVSPKYFQKIWPQLELDALISTGKPVIPVLYHLSIEKLRSLSPLLAGKTVIAASENLHATAVKIKEALHGLVREEAYKSLEGILVIGSVHSEIVLNLHDEISIGQKHIVERRELFGGSGLNISMRLINMGYPAFPILSIGRSRVGNLIRDLLLDAVRTRIGAPQLIDFIQSDDFFCKGINTTQATMAVSAKTHRQTSFIEEPVNPLNFMEFVRDRLQRLASMSNVRISTVVIGHIYADNPAYNKSRPGEISKEIIDTFKNRGIRILTDFGSSQLCTGIDSWVHHLKKLSVFQLSLGEIRIFFSASSKRISLAEMIEYFSSNNITGVITLDRLGALGTYKDGRNGVIFARPLEIINFKDSTGAGDASVAGLASAYYMKPDMDFSGFLESLRIARMWAAGACMTPGGANDCPTREMMETYEKNLDSHYKKEGEKLPPIEVRDPKDFKIILQLIDRAEF